ncbi:MAG: sugar-transfer associated ATP-grasp domain-containing protein [Kofleriaceae bacterium]
MIDAVRGLVQVARRWREVARHRHELVGINQRNVLLVYANNPRRYYPIADDKLLAKQLLAAAGVPVSETLHVCDGLFAIPQVLAALADREQVVIKPANGSGGQGILVVGERLGPGRWRRAGGDELRADEVQRHLAEIILGSFTSMLADKAFVERRIRPHRLFHELWPDGLCDLRIITLAARPVMAMVRVPTRESEGRANLHQGGLGLAIELATGRTFRAVHRGRSVTHHPESAMPLVDLVLPHWAETLDVARRAAAAVPLGYLGCDVVVDVDQGPLVLEINARPGLEIQNVHGYGLGRAIAEAA